MSEPQSGKLSTWKQIAAYLNVSEDTAQKYATHEGLPVRKIRGMVVADSADLDRWFAEHAQLVGKPGLLQRRPPPLRSQEPISEDSKSIGAFWRHVPEHPWFVFTTALFCAALCTVSLLLESAYQFDRFAAGVVRAAPWVFIAGFAVAVITFSLLGILSSRRPPYALWAAIAFLTFGTILIWACSRAVVPNYPIVLAHVQTASGQAAHLRNLLYMVLIVIFFALPQYLFVVTAHRGCPEVRSALKTRSSPVFGPALPAYISPSWMFGLLVLIFVLSFASGYSFLSNLIPAEHYNLFLNLLSLRVALQFALAATCVFWYSEHKLRRIASP